MYEFREEIQPAEDIDATLIVSNYSLPLSGNANEQLVILLLLLAFVGCASMATRLWNRWKKSRLSEEERNPAYMYSWY